MLSCRPYPPTPTTVITTHPSTCTHLQHVEATLREWWDYNLESRNRADFMEQDAMWFMLQAAGAGGATEDPSYNFIINKTNTALISEPEFPSSWHGLNNLWLAHIPNYWPNRVAYFKHMLKMVGMADSVTYGKAARRVLKESYVSVDILAVAEAMEARHPVEMVNVSRVVVNPEVCGVGVWGVCVGVCGCVCVCMCGCVCVCVCGCVCVCVWVWMCFVLLDD